MIEVYGALMLHNAGQQITEENLKKVDSRSKITAIKRYDQKTAATRGKWHNR